jgi:long-chain acyl-CoA synthetase
MPVETLNDIYLLTASIERPSIMKVKKDGRWIDIGVKDFADQVRYLSTALRTLGVKADDRIAILAENRPEWTISDFGALTASAVTVPIYPTLLAWQIEYILNDSGSVVLFVSNEEQLTKVLGVRDHVPSIHTIVVFDPPAVLPDGVQTFDSLLQVGRDCESKEGRGRFDEVLRGRKSADLATIVYTSGTTGNPKGAMLTHGNITSNVLACTSVVPFKIGQLAMSILPLSHILERMADFSYLYKGASIAYAESVTKVRDNLQEVHPQVFAAVPRLFEKMEAAIMENVAASSPLKQRIFHWALGVGRDRLPYRVEEKPMPPGLAIRSAIADRLVFHKILDRMGGQIEFVLSGGAPLSPELAAFFIGAGVEIYEGYGLTETSPVIAINTPSRRRVGTVGPPVPGVEVKIAEDGEILTRGPHVMRGYFNNPEATASAIDADRWFHTGDIGLLDADGFLKITDRKKDIIINAYGKNVAPQPLENLLKTSPYIATPVLIGDRRKFLVALLVPNFEKLEREAAARGLTWSSRQELVSNPQIVEIFQQEIDRFNKNLDRQEKIRRFTILPNDFTIEADEITPSLKVKRKIIDQKYKNLIDAMYADESVGTE